MSDTDQLAYLVNEAAMTLRKIAHWLREGASADIVADQADEDASMLMYVLAVARDNANADRLSE